MEGTLKVDTQTLKNTASDFEGKGTQIHTLTTNMLDLIKGLQASWEGDAFASYTGQFAMLEDDMERMHSRIKEHVTDLTEMAERYEQAENANMETGSALAGDIID